MLCDRCYQLESEGEHGLGLCPLEARREAAAVWQDTIEGGLTIEHGPVGTYDSKAKIREAAKATGWRPWGDVYDESKTKDARVRMDWLKSGEAQREKRERDEARRAGEHRPQMRRIAPKQNSPETRAQIRHAVMERLRAYS